MTEPQPPRLLLTVEQHHDDPDPQQYEDVLAYEIADGFLEITQHMSDDTLTKTTYNVGQWFRIIADGIPAETPKPGKGDRKPYHPYR